MRFSNRLSWETGSNKLSILYHSKLTNGVQVLNLAQSNPTRAGVWYDRENLLKASGKPEDLDYSPDPHGLPAVREAVRAYYQAKKADVPIDSIILTASTSEAYSFIFKLLCDPLDNVLVPLPGYPLFDYLAALDSVEVRRYRIDYLHPHGWRIDLDTLAKQADSKTKAIVLIHPNNPTGSFIRPDELNALNVFCQERGIALIADEVFSDFGLEAPADTIPTLTTNNKNLTFVLSGLSKLAGLPQVKLGWIAVSGPTAVKSAAINKLELISDTFLSVSTPVQNAAIEYFRLMPEFQRRLLKRLQDNLAALHQAFHETPVRVQRVDGGWTAVLEMPRLMSEEEWAIRLLDEENVYCFPGYLFDFEREAFLTVSLLVPQSDVIEGARRILALCGRYS